MQQVLLIAAEEATEKIPFYVLGGALAVWAVVLSAIGLSRPAFPTGPGAQYAVIGISVTLAAATIVAAVATAG
jgi:hypothetical protein